MLSVGTAAAIASKLHGHSAQVEYRHYLGVPDRAAEEAAEAIRRHLEDAR